MEAQVLDALTLYDMLCLMHFDPTRKLPPRPVCRPEPVAASEITHRTSMKEGREETLFRLTLLWGHRPASCDPLLPIHGPRSRHGLRQGWQQAPIGRCPSSPSLLAPTGNQLSVVRLLAFWGGAYEQVGNAP
jgi:hypothetical protein